MFGSRPIILLTASSGTEQSIGDCYRFDRHNYVENVNMLENLTVSGTVSGITKSMVGLGNVDNTTDANKPVSNATQTALNARLR